MKKNLPLFALLILPFFCKGQPYELFESNNFWGIKDSSGNILVPAEYQNIRPNPRFGYAIVQQGMTCGVIDIII
jgi:hypothetical protein